MVVPARRVKTEYMKRFKEPKWESCGACYLELLHYRLSRRLLEQAHRPWLWDGWEQDSGSGGGSTAGSPSPPGAGSPAAAREEEEAAGAAAPSEAGRASPGRERGGGGGTRVSGAAREPFPRRGRAALPFSAGLGKDGSARAALPRLGGRAPIPGAPGPGGVTMRAHPAAAWPVLPAPRTRPGAGRAHQPGPATCSRILARPAEKPWLRHRRCLFKEPSGGNSHPESQPLM